MLIPTSACPTEPRTNRVTAADMSKPISLAQQIEEVEREIKLRESAYRSYGRAGTMRSSEAEFHTTRMKAVLTTLRWLQANEATIRAAVTKSK
jgi:hypothetical protein